MSKMLAIVSLEQTTYDTVNINPVLDETHNLAQQNNIHYFIAEIYIQKKNYKQALKNAKTGLSYAEEVGNAYYEEQSWKQLSSIYELMNKKSEALNAYKIAASMNDSIQQFEKNHYIKEYVTGQQDHSTLSNVVQLKFKIIVGLLVMVTLISMILFLRYKVLDKVKQGLKNEVELKNKELLSFSIQKSQRDELIRKLQVDVIDTFNQIEGPNKVAPKKIGYLFRNIKNTSKDWEEFKIRFEQVDQHFIQTLKKEHTNLSETDIRICALIRLNLSAKEISNMLNITQDSVNKSRYRLRKKLSLDKEVELNHFISSF